MTAMFQIIYLSSTVSKYIPGPKGLSEKLELEVY